MLIALHDKDRQVRASAATAMTNRIWEGSIELLVASLRTETDEHVLSVLGYEPLEVEVEEQVPLELLLNLFDRGHVLLRASVIRILGCFGADAQWKELLIATLGDSNQVVRDAAAAALKQAYPEALYALASKTISTLQGQKPDAPFDSISQAFFARYHNYMGYASPSYL